MRLIQERKVDRLIWTLKGRVASGASIVGGAALVFYFAFYTPQTKMIRVMREDIEKENSRILKIKRKIEEYTEMEKRYKELETELEKLNSFFSPEGKIHSLLQELSLRGQSYGIDYITIAPEETLKGKYYHRVPVRISLNSTYHALGTLLSDIAKRRQKTFLTLDSLEIKGHETGEGTSGKARSHTIEANLVLSLYLSSETPLKPSSPREEEVGTRTAPRRRR
jgi:Tfp pilus assembly protein PilO